jgi:hypothetical protein
MKALEGQVKPENLRRVAARTWPELLAERIVRRSGGTSPTGEECWSGLCVLKTKKMFPSHRSSDVVNLLFLSY